MDNTVDANETDRLLRAALRLEAAGKSQAAARALAAVRRLQRLEDAQPAD